MLKLPDRGIKGRRKPLNSKDALNQRGWTMFKNTKIPFVMMESFFITNNKDMETGNKKYCSNGKSSNRSSFGIPGGEKMNILPMIIIILAAGGTAYILYKKNKLDKTVEYPFR